MRDAFPVPRSSSFVTVLATVCAALFVVAPARAQEKEEAPVDPAVENAQKIERELRALRAEVDDLQEQRRADQERLHELAAAKDRITGYVDFGGFYVQGNGSGIRPDTGHVYFPEYAAVPDTWVFMGDPLSTAINSRGEAPDLGGSRAVSFDPIHNGGKSSFMLNALSVAIYHGIAESFAVTALVDFVPRGRDVSRPDGNALGDYIDVKLAYGEYIAPVNGFDLNVYAGKIDSVLGIEYRSQEAPDRVGVTPSLICRYTCGHPLGLKARARFFDERLAVNLAVTNGSHAVEQFPIYNEVDLNNGKTVAGRVSYRVPVGGRGLEVGISGAYGSQDLQTSDSVMQWHAGLDAHLELGELDVRAELVKGHAEGAEDPGQPPCAAAPCLRYQGGYLQTSYRLTNWFTPYVRADARDALHQSGASFVYISQLARGTGGVRFEIGTHVVLKAEYTHIQELGRAPQFPNDVVSTSAIFRF